MDMNSKPELMERVKSIVEKRGRAALEQARQEIFDAKYDGGAISSALKYFARVTLKGGLPVFPALISLSCEAVGGEPEKTLSIGTALTLIAGTADIHDDIIDQSLIKYSKKTVVGKFGGDIALLAGDTLLIQGLMLFHKECESLSKEQKEKISNLLFQAFIEISQAEVAETKLMKKMDVSSEKYFEIIRMRAVVPELHCRIGAILGNGNARAIEALGNYGKTFGIISTIRDEFIDLLEYQELQNRLKNECPPLPFILALQNSCIKNKVLPLLKNTSHRRKNFTEITKMILESKEVQKLKREIRFQAENASNLVALAKNEKISEELNILLKAPLNYLEKWELKR